MNKIRKKENIGKEVPVRTKKIRINTIARGIFLLHEGIYPGILLQIYRYQYLPTYSFIHSHESSQIFPKTLNIEKPLTECYAWKVGVAGGNNYRYPSSINKNVSRDCEGCKAQHDCRWTVWAGRDMTRGTY
jgi:hypothetical protein